MDAAEVVRRFNAWEPSAGWQPIETAPRPKGDEPCWIIGYTTWGQQVGKFHEWVGPCEWVSDKLGFQFTNTDFDAFPTPTHWHPWPASPQSSR